MKREIDRFQMLFAGRQRKIISGNVYECVSRISILYANRAGRVQASMIDILKVPEIHRFSLLWLWVTGRLTPADLWSFPFVSPISKQRKEVFFIQKYRGHAQCPR